MQSKPSNGFTGQGRVQVKKKRRSLLRIVIYYFLHVRYYVGSILNTRYFVGLRQIIRLLYQSEWVFDNRQLKGGAGGL